MKAALKQFWSERARRERVTIAVGSALLAASIAYAYLWLPIAQSRERLAAELPRLRAEARQMRTAAREVEQVRSAAKPLSKLDDTVRRFTAEPRFAGVNVQLNAEENGRVRASFASIAGDVWFAWLAALSAEHGVRVESARLEMLEQAGVVKATATLAAGRP